MNKFWETYNLLKLNQEETAKLNKCLTTKEIKAVIKEKNQKQKNLPTNKSPGLDGFPGEFCATVASDPFHSPNYTPKTVNELKAIADLQRRETIGHIYLEVKTISVPMSEISYWFLPQGVPLSYL